MITHGLRSRKDETDILKETLTGGLPNIRVDFQHEQQQNTHQGRW